MSEDSGKTEVVYVGRKPLRVYTNRASEVVERDGLVLIGARGALISRAILVASRVGNVVQAQVEVEKAEGNDGVMRDVPAIELTVGHRAIGGVPVENTKTVLRVQTEEPTSPAPRTRHAPVEDSIPTLVG